MPQIPFPTTSGVVRSCSDDGGGTSVTSEFEPAAVGGLAVGVSFPVGNGALVGVSLARVSLIGDIIKTKLNNTTIVKKIIFLLLLIFFLKKIFMFFNLFENYVLNNSTIAFTPPQPTPHSASKAL